jgi:uncharacterized protein with HEPN domain
VKLSTWQIIWETATRDVPELRKQVLEIIALGYPEVMHDADG